MTVSEVGYYYAGGKNLSKIRECLLAIANTPKDQNFFSSIEERFREIGFVDAWGGAAPTLGLLVNWGLISQEGISKISFATTGETPYELTDEGRKFLKLNENERKEFLLKHALQDGLMAMLELIYERGSESQACTLQWLRENWNEKVGLPSGKWASEYTRGQNIETRRSWANEFRLIAERGRPINFSLTKEGFKVLTKYGEGTYPEIPTLAEKIRVPKMEYSHSDVISDLLDIGKVLGFQPLRTPTINELLPPEKHMRQRIKELDCAWYIHHPFTGNIWIPIEVQKGGSVEDALFRLNAVSDQSHRLVIVCDESETETIAEMAERQRIPKEKLVFFSFEEIKEIKQSLNKVEQMKKKLLGTAG